MAKKSSTPKSEFADKGSQAFAGLDRMIFGKVPAEFSPRRLMAANALGFRFFKLNAEERAQLNDDNYIYDGMFWDASLCAFLCLCNPSFLFKAVRVPEAAISEIMGWIDTNKLSAGTSGFKEVMEHYNSVMEAIVRSSAEEIPDARPGNGVGARDTGLSGE